jgi:hypothetical protein
MVGVSYRGWTHGEPMQYATPFQYITANPGAYAISPPPRRIITPSDLTKAKVM